MTVFGLFFFLKKRKTPNQGQGPGLRDEMDCGEVESVVMSSRRAIKIFIFVCDDFYPILYMYPLARESVLSHFWGSCVCLGLPGEERMHRGLACAWRFHGVERMHRGLACAWRFHGEEHLENTDPKRQPS